MARSETRTFTAGLPATVYVGFVISSSSNTVSASATFSDVHVRDLAGQRDHRAGRVHRRDRRRTPAAVAPTPPPTGPSHPDDQSRGATPAEPALLSGSVSRYNLEGFAAGPVTGGGNIPDTRSALSQGDHGHRTGRRAQRCAKASGANPVKVIEIMNDLNMGWNEVGTLLQARRHPLRTNIAAARSTRR